MEPKANKLVDVILPIEISNGNDGRGGAWYRSNKQRKDFEQILRAHGFERTPFSVRCYIVVTRILGPRQRLWDADSVGRGSAKELLDALVACGWFHDDKPTWIRPVDYRQDETRRNLGPATQIEVYGNKG